MRNIKILLVLFLLVNIIFCGQSKLDDYENRLAQFKSLLNQNELELFENSKWSDAAVTLHRRVINDEEFKSRLEAIKTKEAIDMHDMKQTVEHFGIYIQGEIELLKQ